MNNRRRSLLAFLAVLGIVAGGSYAVVDTVGSGPSGAHVLTVHALSWWPYCSQPPSHPNNEVANIRADIDAGKPVAGYWLIAPPRSFGLADTPANEIEAGKRSADIARENIPDDVWDKLQFASGDTEVPGVCAPDFNIPIATIDAAMAEMATMKCLANIPDPCIQVDYTSYGEWTGHVTPSNPPFPENTMLWLAHWNGDPSFASFDQYPFGGLTRDDVLLKQYQGDTLYNNVSVDLDSIEVDQRVFDGVTPTPTPVVTATPEPTPMIVTWHAPPELRAECYSGIVDTRYGDWWSLCAQRWVFPDLSSYEPSTNTHFYPNGVAVQ